MAPGAADKWKVFQIFHESISRSRVRIEHIDRIVAPDSLADFLGSCESQECGVGFYAPSGSSQLARLKTHGFCAQDFEEVPCHGFGVPIASQAVTAHQRSPGPLHLSVGNPCGGERCLCVVLTHPLDSTAEHSLRSSASGTCREYCVKDPSQLLLAHLVWYQQLPEDRPPNATDVPAPLESLEDLEVADRRRRLAKQQREYVKVRDPLIKVALQGLDTIPAGSLSTVLLPSTSVEAESVVNLYILGGGGSRHQRPPGVTVREALGGVVVQRIENQQLFEEYSAFAHDGSNGEKLFGAPRYREDVVWHGTRVKRIDGEGTSLATKLKSIAEHGFDPSRCMKGAAAEGGIWVASSPLASFGSGCDGLVAFVLCLAKTHFNEWVDSNCARVLQRERVLPLYAIVHA